MRRTRVALLTVLMGVLLIGGCAAPPKVGATVSTSAALTPASASASSSAPSKAPVESAAPVPALLACATDALPTRLAGTFTIGVGRDLRAPWFVGNDPATADGYEAQLVRGVARTLGFADTQLVWTQLDADAVLAGNTTAFDVFVNQLATPPARATVDLSTGYYGITDSVLAPRPGPLDPKIVLSQLPLDVVAGGTGADSLGEYGLSAVGTVDSSAAAIAQVTSLATAAGAGTIGVAGGVRGVVVPTPTAIAAVQANPELTILGQLIPESFQPDQFHLALPHGSALTPCVSAAVDRLRVEGVIEQLTQTWITDSLAPALPR